MFCTENWGVLLFLFLFLLRSEVGKFDRLGTLAEGIMSALPAAEITIMAYGKIPKVQNHEEKTNSWGKYFRMLLRRTKELLYRKENEFDCLLPFSRVAGPAG